VCFMVDTICINYYLWKAGNNEVRIYRVAIGMGSEDYAQKRAGNEGIVKFTAWNSKHKGPEQHQDP